MRDMKELEILILELIYKHPSINNTYSLTRFFAKSSILPDKLYATLKDLVAIDYISINETINTINHYKITLKGKAVLDKIDVFDYTEGFAWEIDTTGFIAKIVFLLLVSVALFLGSGCSASKKNSCGCPNKKGMVGY